MTFKQICKVDNNQIIIRLPENFTNKKQVTIIVDDEVDSKTQKLEMLKQAASDPLFLSDIKEIHQDFDSIDNEIE